MRSWLLGSGLFLSLAVGSSGCAKPAPTPAPATPVEPAAGAPADEAGPDANVGYGQCCKGESCEGQRYESAHAFAQACAEMGADKADWCPDECDLSTDPYTCECNE